MDEYWIVVERGEQPLDTDTFRLSDLCIDHYGQLTDRAYR